MSLGRKNMFMTGYDLALRSYHVHGSSKHGIAHCTFENNDILKPSSNLSPYIFTLVQKVKHRVYKIHVFLSEAILIGYSASYFI